MWFIQALRIVFHENVPQEVLEMSCSWFLGVFEGLSGLKSNLGNSHFSFILSWKYFVSGSSVSIPVKVVVLIHFSLNRAEKCSSIHCYLAFCILVFITYLQRLVHISIFLSLFIFSCVILLLICKVLVTFFKLALKMISKRRTIFSLVFMLKIFYSCCYCYCYFGPREFTGDPRHSPIRLSRPKKKNKKHSTGQKILDWSKTSRPVKKFSTSEKNSRPVKKNSRLAKKNSPHTRTNLERSISILKGRICISLDGMTSGLGILKKYRPLLSTMAFHSSSVYHVLLLSRLPSDSDTVWRN